MRLVYDVEDGVRVGSVCASGKERICQGRLEVRDTGLIPGLGRSPGGHGNPLWDSCLKNPMDREAWQAIAERLAKSRIQLRD